MIKIRLEEKQDYRIVEEVTKEAFSYPERIERSEIGCCLEHYMVHSLREKDGINELSFVAEIDGKIVGHIIYSKAYILQPDNSKLDVVSFGPLSVLPKYQKQGVGTALMKHSIQCAKELGYGAILFFGRPEYYPRFGFVEAAKFKITDCDGNNYPAFMAMELKKDYLKDITGRFYESSIYNDDLNREQAKDFNERFCKEMNGVAKLIILRGNSGSGKTTTGKALQRKFGHGTMLISQDVVRREILFVKDGPDTEASGLLWELSQYGRRNCNIVILEGILNSKWYKSLFENLLYEFKDQIFAYYFDIPFEETLKRHQHKPNAHEFGEKEMRRWWNEKDLLDIIPEALIYKESSLDETVDIIHQDVIK